MAQRKVPPAQELSADDFFEEDDGFQRRYSPRTEGSLAVRREVGRPDMDLPFSSEDPSVPKKVKHVKEESRRVEQQPGPALKNRYERFTEAHDMGQIKNKFGFFVFAVAIAGGLLYLMMMYIQVFNLNASINDLEAQLQDAQKENNVEQQQVSEQMNMSDLYAYAVGTLGMVEADSDHTIIITVDNQSYTTSNLPVADISDSKVTFHWFR